MKFITEAKLNCGHEITFGTCGAPGNPGQMTHQKDPPIAAAYADFLENNPITPKRILEIGVCRGGSLAIWREMFAPCDIIGIDNNLGQLQPWTLDHYKEDNQIQIHHMNMPDPNVSQFGMFDLIIDDGGHGVAAVLPTFKLCWPMLNSTGLYIVEDWIANGEARMINYFIDNMVGYWADSNLVPDSPLSLMIYRTFFAMRKQQK